MTRDLTQGSPMKLIFGFSVSTLFGLLFQQMYNMVDTMIVGKLLGAQALASVGATGSVSFLVVGFCCGVCSGFSIPVAQQMGAGDREKMRRFVANAAYLSAGFALVMTVATCLLCRRILLAMHTPEDVLEDSFRYIFVIFLGIPVTFLYNILAGVIRALGDSRTPVLFLALSSILNIVLDVTFILACRMGVAGAAVATVLSQGVSGALCLLFVYVKFPVLHISRAERRPDARLCRELLAMGVPMGLQYSITAVGSVILQSAVNRLGSLCVAAVTAGSKVTQLLACPFDAMGSAMATYCGQNAGAGKLDRLGRGVRDCSLMGLVYSLAALALMLLLAPVCAMWFIDPAETQVELLTAYAARFIRVNAAFFFPLALVNIVRFSIQGMGFPPFAILAGVMEMLARTLMGRFLVPKLGFGAACFASPVAWLAADAFLIPACAWCIARLRRRLGRPHPAPGMRLRRLHG